ncbi:MAG: hypothetical protein LBQ50_00490 [Planctomycetaceae bacterium]|jgi:predicted esterase|nr:hypothetical protein [Planctomycetaceae bacterium]
MKTVRNVGIVTFTVCFFIFLFFGCGRPATNNVTAQNLPTAKADLQVDLHQTVPKNIIQNATSLTENSTPLELQGFVLAQANKIVAINPDNSQQIYPYPPPGKEPKEIFETNLNLAVPVKPVVETPKPLTQEQLEAIAIQPATKYEETGSRVVPAMLPLFREESITYTGKDKYKNTTLKYRLHVPEIIEPGKKYPIILWLHGAGEVGDDNKLQLVHLHHIITYLTGEKKREFFLLVPQAPQQHGSWDAHSYIRPLPELLAKQLETPDLREKILKQYESAFGSETKTNIAVSEFDGQTVLEIFEPFEDSPLGFSFAMLDQVMSRYPVDADRVTVSGLSTGGDGTWRALERRPELFAAAVPLVSWRAITDIALQKSPVLKQIPVWAIYSSDDSGIDQARADFERVEKAGCNVKKSEFGICGHNAWTPAMLQADIFSWLLSRAKKDGEYVAVVDANVNPDDLKGIVDVATRDPAKPKLAPAQPESVQQSVKKIPAANPISKAEMKQAATFSVPQPLPTIAGTQSPQDIVAKTVVVASNSVTLNLDKDKLYTFLSIRYLLQTELHIKDRVAGLERSFGKLSPNTQQEFLVEIFEKCNNTTFSLEILLLLEKFIDQLPATVIESVQSDDTIIIPAVVTKVDVIESPQRVPQEELQAEPPQMTAPSGGGEEVTVTEKIVEDCDRPWAMTSDSLYGMFPADWNKEAQKIPEFIVNLTSDELAKKLAASVSGDGQDFLAACRSILALENKPMSSPWFETGGGRLRSDIRYTLSAKGQMFVRLLKTVRDSTGSAEKNNLAKIARSTLEKIELVLEK